MNGYQVDPATLTIALATWATVAMGATPADAMSAAERVVASLVWQPVPPARELLALMDAAVRWS